MKVYALCMFSVMVWDGVKSIGDNALVNEGVSGDEKGGKSVGALKREGRNGGWRE